MPRIDEEGTLRVTMRDVSLKSTDFRSVSIFSLTQEAYRAAFRARRVVLVGTTGVERVLKEKGRSV